MPAEALHRVLGTVSAGGQSSPAGECGPLVLVTVGLHGNEPAGLHAMRRVLRDLARHRVPLAGRVAAFVGNRAGLTRNVRYVDEDLNRLWSRGRVEELRRADPRADNVERGEQRELLDLIEGELESAESDVVHLDLHSTSGDGPPFTVLAGPTSTRGAAERLRVPTLVGLESLVAGTLIEYVGSLGHAALVLEGGQNDAAATVDHHESAVWITLCGAGVVADGDVPGGLARHESRLAASADGLPATIEIGYVHRLAPGEEFAMRPGYRNFQSVAAGELLAHSGPGLAAEIRAPWAGFLLMPRYQGQGLDGFFLGRAARPSDPHPTATTLG